FRQLRSTTDNLVLLESQIHEAFVEGQKVLAVFFDIKRAFDTAWRHAITKKLHDWGIKGKILKFVENFLGNRSFRVLANGHLSSSRLQQNGTPQGSVLSSTLFLI